MPDKRLFLLDGFALIYRAFYSMGKNFLYNSKGVNTTAIRGFASTVEQLIRKEKPTHIALVMDAAGPTDRAVEHTFYKANRPPMPDDLRASIPYILELTKGFNIPIIELPGYEADDLIGTIAKETEQQGFQIFMVTPDKDFGQLVSENIFMYKPARSGNSHEVLGVKEILEKWDIERIDQVIDMLGMMGDASDNIPGIPGIGEKTAVKLLKQYGSMEGLYENTDKLKGKQKEKVEANKELAFISKSLATIIIDSPVEYNVDDFILEEVNKDILEPLFAELEFKTLGERILGKDFKVSETKAKANSTGQMDLFGGAVNQVNETLLSEEKEEGQTIENTKHEYILIDNQDAINSLIEQLLAQKVVCFDTETTSVNANDCELVGLAFSWETQKAYYVPIPEDQTAAKKIVEQFKPFFENEAIAKVGQNLKYDIVVMKWYGIETKGNIHDTMLQHYLIEPDMRHNLNFLSETYLGYSPVSIETLIGKKGKNQLSMRTVSVEKVKEYAGEDADLTWQLYQKFQPSLVENNLDSLYQKVETPVSKVLADMEYEGVALDTNFLAEYAKELNIDLLHIQTEIHEIAGEEFNIGSTKQLGEVLFDKMEIPYKGKKNTKSGWYSTDEQMLQRLADKHPIANKILEFRGVKKLLNTYVEALPKLINPKSGRLHTTFNQAVASTGRLSSSDPNLQNIPIRTERGRKVRKAFVPRSENHILLAADYSQIELRLMAAMSGDENMKAAFIDGLDIHSATAAKVYGVDLEAVDKTMRRNAKMVNFGIIYGISAFGLAQRLDIKRTEAQTLIEEYFKQYPGIERYMNEAVNSARENGYVETLLGRRRYLKEIHSKNHTQRAFAERTAINMPIQGTAADMIKLAMIDVQAEMKARKLQSRMILQVHDELLFDVLKPELEEMRELVIDKMANAMELEVPIIVEAGTGQNWLEAH